jgi:hypothetical protein
MALHWYLHTSIQVSRPHIYMDLNFQVGSYARGMFLVHSECLETNYIASRPFRVNAVSLKQIKWQQATVGIGIFQDNDL